MPCQVNKCRRGSIRLCNVTVGQIKDANKIIGLLYHLPFKIAKSIVLYWNGNYKIGQYFYGILCAPVFCSSLAKFSQQVFISVGRGSRAFEYTITSCVARHEWWSYYTCPHMPPTNVAFCLVCIIPFTRVLHISKLTILSHINLCITGNWRYSANYLHKTKHPLVNIRSVIRLNIRQSHRHLYRLRTVI